MKKKQILKLLALVFVLALAITAYALPMSAETYLSGDMNGDGQVDSDDAIQLVRHTIKPAKYTITQNGDTNGDDLINSDDGIYLLRHVFMPDLYPLECNHNLTEYEAKAPTCTDIGWDAYVTCSICDYTTLEVIYATGHSFGEWITVTQETCTENGEYTRICDNCDATEKRTVSALQHRYECTDSYTEDGIVYDTYTCERCNDTYDVETDTIVVQYTDMEIFDCAPNYTFNVVSEGDEQYLLDNIKIYSVHFEGSEYADNEDIYIPFSAVLIGESVWQISANSEYEYSSTYIAKLSEDVFFEEYVCNRLIFTVENDPNHEDVIVYNDNIVFLKTLEEQSPGYYPYYVEDYENSEFLYLIVQKADGLRVGQIICIGDIYSLDDLSNPDISECYIGKIGEINRSGQAGYIIRLDAPDINEVFDELDIVYENYIDFEENVEIAEDLDQQIIDVLYGDEDYANFLNSASLAAQSYLEEKGLDATVADADNAFLDKISIKPTVSVNGTTLVLDINGCIAIPIKTNSGTNLGSINISFKFSASTNIEMSLNYKLDQLKLKNFDLRFNQTNDIKFEFDVSINMEYSLKEESTPDYALNTKVTPEGTQKIHHASCLYVSRIKDKSQIRYLTFTEADKLLQDTELYEGCLICQPSTGLIKDTLIVNTANSVVHAYNCYHVGALADENRLLSNKSVDYWVGIGYDCCDWCKPQDYESNDFKQRMLDSFYYSDWGQNLQKITNILVNSNSSDGNKKSVTVVNIPFPIAGPVAANIKVNVVFDFKLDASLSYKYEFVQNNTFGIRNEGDGFNPYSAHTEDVPTNSLELMGKAELKAGLEIDASISIKGIGKWANAGLRAGLGCYARVAGIYADNNVSDYGADYAAAYFEIGLYIDVDGYYKLLWFDDSINILYLEKTLLGMGYDTAYYSYVEYCDSLEINGSYNIADNDLLMVNCFDLKTMTPQTSELSAVENGRYRISFYFEDGRYCDVVNGVIVATDDAPEHFTDRMIISVEGDDSWKKYQKGNAIFYLPDYVIDIDFYNGYSEGLEFTSNGDGTCYVSGIGTCTDTDIEIPTTSPEGDSVTSIGSSAFSGCSSLTSVTLPDSVTSIGDYAFYDCDSLTSVTIPDIVTSIGDDAFWRCTSLTSVTIPDSVTSIGGGAFTDCDSLTSVTIGNGVESIGEEAFCSCDSLTSVTIGDSVTSIRRYAFYYCTSLTSVTIGDSVTSIGYDAFYCCYKLVEVINKSGLNITKGSSSNGYVAWYALEVHSGESKIVNKDDYLFYTYDNVNYLFGYVGNDTELVLPESYNGQNYEIYEYALYGCTSITSVKIPDSVTSIGESAFYACESLTSITIPDSVTSIGNNAFSNCDILTSIVFEDTSTWYRTTSSSYTGGTQTSVTNSSTNAAYFTSNYRNYYWYFIDEEDEPTASEGLKFKSNGDGTCYVSGIGTCTDTDIIIPEYSPEGDRVTSIERYTFYGCDSLTSVTIPDSVASIGSYAFAYCDSLKGVTIPDSVTSIGSYVFAYCNSLTSVIFEDTSTWYVDEVQVDVTNASTNATNFKNTYKRYYWYKK